jgi:3-deoxy-D-manno-octulosonic acid kinase
MEVLIPEWMGGEFRVIRGGASRAIVRHDFVPSFEAHRLIECPLAPALSLPSGRGAERLAGGRGTVRVLDAGPLGEAVVRPYRRGGVVEHVNPRRYFLGNRAFDELVATHRLRRRGAPVPEVLAAVQASLRPGYGACLVTRRVARTRPASVVLASAEAPVETVMEAMGRAVRALHAAGGIHADLNAHNLLVSEDGPVTIIDLDRARVASGPAPNGRARANLGRLQRSLVKLGLRRAVECWDAFAEGYGAPPDPPAAA